MKMNFGSISAIALWRVDRRPEAGFALRRAADHAPQVEAYGRAFAQALAEEPSIPVYAGPERNLIVTSSEVCHKHGVGVLIKRFFSSHLDAVTLRSLSHFEGIEEVGGTHLCLPFEELSPAELQTRLRRLLAPYAIRRIMCVPFRREESIYAIAAQEVTGAALCTYVMDDRNVMIRTRTIACCRSYSSARPCGWPSPRSSRWRTPSSTISIST